MGFVREFRWLTANAIPLHLDLRDCGWTLLDRAHDADDCMGVAHVRGMTPRLWLAFLPETKPDGRH